MKNLLAEEDMKIVELKYGRDLSSAKTSNISIKDNRMYYSRVAPKIKMLLANPDKDIKIKKRDKVKYNTIYEYFSKFTKDEIDIMLERLPENIMNILKLRFGENLCDAKNNKLSDKENDRFYTKIAPKLRDTLSIIREELTALNMSIKYDFTADLTAEDILVLTFLNKKDHIVTIAEIIEATNLSKESVLASLNNIITAREKSTKKRKSKV